MQQTSPYRFHRTLLVAAFVAALAGASSAQMPAARGGVPQSSGAQAPGAPLPGSQPPSNTGTSGAGISGIGSIAAPGSQVTATPSGQTGGNQAPPSAATSGTSLPTPGSATDAAIRAQQRYDADIAVCNGAGYPAPQREACIRNAGQRFDQSRGIAPTVEAATATDGRATVMTPLAGSSALRGSTTTTSSDGRATVVVPTP